MAFSLSHVKFLEAKEITSPKIVLLGVPLDATESFRAGTKYAPEKIRELSQALESYSPERKKDLADLPLADWGNLNIDASSVEDALKKLESFLDSLNQNIFPVLLGGEHTITLGALRALKKRYPDLFLLQFDAHLDLRDSYQGKSVSHATVMRRIIDEIGTQNLCQLGIRSGSKEEFEFAESRGISFFSSIFPTGGELERVRHKPVYLAIDIDVLDPAYAPGTGCPEPSGWSTDEFIAALQFLEDLNIVALDLTEVSPPQDPADITSLAAAKILREAMLLFF